MKECLICKTEFVPYSKKHICCSRKCIDIKSKYDKRKKGKDWTKTCEICNKVYKNKIHNSKTCSKECAKVRAKKIRPKEPSKIQPAITRTCYCGKQFEAVGLGRTRLSCSDKCAKERRERQTMQHYYDNYIPKMKKCIHCDKEFKAYGRQTMCGSIECKKQQTRYYNRKHRKPRCNIKTRAYRNRNKERINTYFREYGAKRRKNPKHLLSGRMYAALRREIKKYKLGVSTTNTLNNLYSIEELYNHLESQFTEGMSWDNMGEWHIDHIRPVASFNYTTTECEDFKKCWALNNLQPLWAKDNMSKGNNWDGVVNA